MLRIRYLGNGVPLYGIVANGVATLCDRCGVDASERIQLHNRTGRLDCMGRSAPAPEAGGEGRST